MSEDTRQLQAEESALVRRLAALPRSIEPGHDLWPAVGARIAPPARPAGNTSTPRLARVAGMALALTGALLAGAWLGFDYASRQATAPARVAAAPAPELERLELAFSAARESYLRQLALGGARLDASEREALSSQLTVIDQAVHQLREAMAADPRNPIYLDALVMTREREMELLADISTANFTRL
jgi:hypothetical protein